MNLFHGFKNYFNHKSKKRIKEINKKKYDILIIDTQKDIQKSIKRTLETTGKAIISTTIVLSLGFAVLYFSELMPNHEFGILSTIILIAALIGSIVLLPALLVLFKPKLKVKENGS